MPAYMARILIVGEFGSIVNPSDLQVLSDTHGVFLSSSARDY